MSADDEDIPCVDFGTLERIYDCGFYDGVLSGAARLDGKRVWFEMEHEWFIRDGYAFPRIFSLYEMTDEEWAQQDENTAAFSRMVSSVRDYRVPKEDRAVKPGPWDDYYKNPALHGPKIDFSERKRIAIASRLPTVYDESDE